MSTNLRRLDFEGVIGRYLSPEERLEEQLKQEQEDTTAFLTSLQAKAQQAGGKQAERPLTKISLRRISEPRLMRIRSCTITSPTRPWLEIPKWYLLFINQAKSPTLRILQPNRKDPAAKKGKNGNGRMRDYLNFLDYFGTLPIESTDLVHNPAPRFSLTPAQLKFFTTRSRLTPDEFWQLFLDTRFRPGQSEIMEVMIGHR